MSIIASGFAAVVGVCVVGFHSGDTQCYDTLFESRYVIDCQDSGRPTELALAERGSGYMRIGNIIDGEFVENYSWNYMGGGWHVISWPTVQVLLVVDEFSISSDSFENTCTEFNLDAP